jgi:PAS domain S-box-containing protein
MTNLNELIDLDKLKNNFEKFSAYSGLTVSLFDYHSGTLIIRSGWNEFCSHIGKECTDYIHACLDAKKRHIEEPFLSECHYGLNFGVNPISIGGEIVASIVIGQTCYEKLSEAKIQRIIDKFSFDRAEYEEFLTHVPVVPKEKLELALGFIASQTELMFREAYHKKLFSEQKKRFELAVDGSGDCLWEYFADTDELAVTCADNRVFGGNVPDGLENFVSMLAPEHAQEFRSLTKRCAGGKEPVFDLNLRITVGNELKWIAVKGKSICENGKCSGIIGFITDITAIKNSEEQLELILNNSLVGVLVVKDRYILKINKTGLDIFGYSENELIGEHVDIIHTSKESSAKFGEMYYNKTTEEDQKLEYPFRKKDGSAIWLGITGKAIDKSKLSSGVVWVFRDVSEEKKNNERLSILSETIEQSPISVAITDKEGFLKYVNPFFSELSGYSQKEVIGQNINIVKSGAHDNKFYKQLWETINSGKIWTGEFINKRKDGLFFAELARIAPLTDKSGEITHFVAIKTDITLRKQLESEILEKSSYIQHILDSQQNMIIVTNGKEILSYNKSCKDFFGDRMTDEFNSDINNFYSLMIGPDYIHNDGRGSLISKLTRLRLYGKDAKLSMNNTKGEPRTFLVNLNESEHRQDREYIISLTDISEQERLQSLLKNSNKLLDQTVQERTKELKDAYTQLKENKDLLSKAQKVARMGGWSRDIHTRRGRWTDEAFYIFGLDPKPEAPSIREILFATHPDDRELVRIKMENIFTGEGEKEYVSRIIRPNGEERLISTAYSYEYDVYGAPVRVNGIHHDQTENILAKMKIEKHETLLKSILSSIKAGICVLDGNCEIELVNPEFGEIAGNRKNPLGMSFQEAFPDMMNSSARELLLSALFEGLNLTGIEYGFRLHNGQARKIILSVMRMNPGEEHKLTLISASDITELDSLHTRQKEQEAMLIQQSKMAAMGEMIGVITHQWKQPLNAIAMLSQLIEAEFERNELTENNLAGYIGNITGQVEFMTQTVHDFRDFFKPGHSFDSFEISEALNEIVQLVAIHYANSNIEIRMPEKAIDKIYVCGAKSEFKQIIINLLANSKDAIAAKRTRDKTHFDGIIRIDFEETGDDITVHLCDNGGGIPEIIMDKIFQSYFTTKGNAGTGIGLYISKVIAETRMKGDISVKNRDGGAVFSLRIKKSDN